jgi:hypothetical protein
VLCLKKNASYAWNQKTDPKTGRPQINDRLRAKMYYRQHCYTSLLLMIALDISGWCLNSNLIASIKLSRGLRVHRHVQLILLEWLDNGQHCEWQAAGRH